MGNEEKKTSPIIVDHWKNKFEKAIRILLQNGINSNELIEKIKLAENEKDN
jgi:hypothetical protein